MARTVQCAKLGRELPGLDDPPFPGALGLRIYDNISQDAFDMWEEQAKVIINHYQLNLADPEARAFLREQMEDFFFGEDAQMPEGWTPAGSGKGGGAPAKGGAAPAKGGGAPAQK